MSVNPDYSAVGERGGERERGREGEGRREGEGEWGEWKREARVRGTNNERRGGRKRGSGRG